MAAYVIAGFGLVALSQPAHAEEEHIYDVKAICGQEEGRILAPGQYWTAINILNPGEEPVKVEARVSTALPGFVTGSLSPPKEAELPPNHAFEIDCPSIMEIGDQGDFLKGFVIVRASGKLAIVAVYTQADLEGRAVSIHTERVPSRTAAGCPDLRVKEILDPTWDSDNRQSVIRAVIQNIGSMEAAATLARLIDPSTTQPTGAPFNDVVNTGPIPAGGEVTVTFHLPYWVFNPNAELEVTADYKGTLEECDETNNKTEYFNLG